MKQFLIRRIRNNPASNSEEPAGVLQVEDSGIIRSADATAERLFGYNTLQMQGADLNQLVASPEDNPLAPPLSDTLSSGESSLITVCHESGSFLTLSIEQAVGERSEAVQPRLSIVARQGMPLDTRILQLAEESADIGVWEMAPESNRVFWSDGIFRLLGMTPGVDIDPEHVLYYFQEHQGRVRRALDRCIRHGEGFSLEVPVLTADDDERWVRLTGHSLRDENRVYAVAGTAVDITRQRTEEQAAHAWKHRTQSVLAASDDLIVIMNPELEIVALNRAFIEQFENTFGVTPNVGDQLVDLLEDFPDERRLYNRLWERALKQEGFCVEMPLAQSDEQLPVFEIQFHRIFSPSGELLGAAHVARSMSARQGVQDNLHYLNSHDPLTGLLNRRELMQRLQRALSIARDVGTPHTLVYLDLDGFTGLNERFGSGGSDRYLREVSRLMMSRLRQRDAIARVASDQFAIVLDNCGPEEARKVADNLREAVAGFTYEWRGETMQTTISGGLLPLIDEQDTTPEQCLTLAADLCETAKTSGPSHLHVYRTSQGADSQTHAREELAQLQNAIHTDGIELLFQALRPITSATWGDHVEVLTRLRREPSDNGEVHEQLWQPHEFMPLAERFDLGSALDRQVITKALAWLEMNPLMQPRLKMISFNLSSSSLLDEGFAEEITHRIEHSSFTTESFCFEIRERDAANYPEATQAVCQRLKKAGCRVALDGAGISGATHDLMTRLDVDIIKIDESLMQDLANNPLQRVMVEALHQMATLTNAVTVAPFIEDDATLRLIREMGLHFGQGYRLTTPELLNELAPPDHRPEMTGSAQRRRGSPLR